MPSTAVSSAAVCLQTATLVLAFARLTNCSCDGNHVYDEGYSLSPCACGNAAVDCIALHQRSSAQDVLPLAVAELIMAYNRPKLASGCGSCAATLAIRSCRINSQHMHST